MDQILQFIDRVIPVLWQGTIITLQLASVSLLLGMAVLMLGHGLQGTLLSLRAALEGFALPVTGIVMSGYYLGLVAAPFIVPHFVGSVGHVRVFAALRGEWPGGSPGTTVPGRSGTT